MKRFSLKLVVPLVLGTAIAIASSLVESAQAFTFSTLKDTNGNSVTAGNPTGQTLSAIKITPEDINQSFQINWFLGAGSSGGEDDKGKPLTTKTPFDFSATGTFTVKELTSGLLSLSVTLTNTTVDSFQAAILALGLGVDPNATAVFASGQTGKIFDTVSTGSNQNFPGGFKDIDVCVYAANNCSGGKIKDGLQAGGKSDTFTLNISGNFGTDPSVTLNSFPIKIQTSDGSFQLAGIPYKTQKPRPVPEPGTTAGLGLLALAGLIQRKRKALKA